MLWDVFPHAPKLPLTKRVWRRSDHGYTLFYLLPSSIKLLPHESYHCSAFIHARIVGLLWIIFQPSSAAKRSRRSTSATDFRTISSVVGWTCLWFFWLTADCCRSIRARRCSG